MSEQAPHSIPLSHEFTDGPQAEIVETTQEAIFKSPEADAAGAIIATEEQIAVDSLEGITAYDQKIYRNGAKHVYGMTSEGKRVHLRHDDILAAYGKARQYQGKAPGEEESNSQLDTDAVEDDPTEFKNTWGVTPAEFDALSRDDQVKVLAGTYRKAVESVPASVQQPNRPIVKRTLSEAAAMGPLRMGWSEEGGDKPSEILKRAAFKPKSQPVVSSSPKRTLSEAAAMGPLNNDSNIVDLAAYRQESTSSETERYASLKRLIMADLDAIQVRLEQDGLSADQRSELEDMQALYRTELTNLSTRERTPRSKRGLGRIALRNNAA